MKTYVGIRVFGHGKILVISAGTRVYLAHPIKGRTPDYDWGYGGLGPSEAALALLSDVLVRASEGPRAERGEGEAAPQVSPDLRKRFNDEVISKLPRGRYLRGIHEEWRLTEHEIRQWIDGMAAIRHEDAVTHAGPMDAADLPGPVKGTLPAPEGVTPEQPKVPVGAAPPVIWPRPGWRKPLASQNRWAVASLISGAVALILLPNLLGPLAVILGAAAVGRKERYGIVGMVLGGGAMVYVLYRAFRAAGGPRLSMIVGLPAVVLLVLTLAAGAYLAMAYRERRRSAAGPVNAQAAADRDRREP